MGKGHGANHALSRLNYFSETVLIRTGWPEICSRLCYFLILIVTVRFFPVPSVAVAVIFTFLPLPAL